MKKLFFLIAALVLLLSLFVGCGDDNPVKGLTGQQWYHVSPNSHKVVSYQIYLDEEEEKRCPENEKNTHYEIAIAETTMYSMETLFNHTRIAKIDKSKDVLKLNYILDKDFNEKHPDYIMLRADGHLNGFLLYDKKNDEIIVVPDEYITMPFEKVLVSDKLFRSKRCSESELEAITNEALAAFAEDESKEYRAKVVLYNDPQVNKISDNTKTFEKIITEWGYDYKLLATTWKKDKPDSLSLAYSEKEGGVRSFFYIIQRENKIYKMTNLRNSGLNRMKGAEKISYDLWVDKGEKINNSYHDVRYDGKHKIISIYMINQNYGSGIPDASFVPVLSKTDDELIVDCEVISISEIDDLIENIKDSLIPGSESLFE